MKSLGIVILVLCLPLAVFAMILPVNDYRAIEGLNIPECDGPIAVLIFIVPTLAIYGIGTICYGRLGGAGNIAVALLCGLVFFATIPNLRAAYDEMQWDHFQEVCRQ